MNNQRFNLISTFSPAGDQPTAIKKLSRSRPSRSVLLGVTGSGKTFTLANVIANINKPTLVLAPNKTLAAQLFEEFSLFFPQNKICYFVSYYDYYQPESYLPAQDIYIPKETKINSEIERLRIEATASLMGRKDLIIVSSVSAIYSLGKPSDYQELSFLLKIGIQTTRSQLIEALVSMQYKRNDFENSHGIFKVLGSTISINVPYMQEKIRVELFDNHVSCIEAIDKESNSVVEKIDNIRIFPAKHFLVSKIKKENAVSMIKKDLEAEAQKIENPIYKGRLLMRVSNDIEMLEETGYCSGIENYSRYFDGRKLDEPPYSLLDFFPKDFLFIIDESHVAIPQLQGMYKGDKARKQALVDFGFRLSSAFDNRPLRFDEIEKYFNDVIFVSATPSKYEREISTNIVEQIVRPTGVVDPTIEIVKREGQLDHLEKEIKKVTQKGFRTLITVLTKREAESLSRFLEKKKIKVCYMHSEIKTPQRTEILHKLRTGVLECIVGINLLREGLDLPEVALVAILDADIESFLRDSRSLIQTIGRAARNTESKVIFYADKITKSMQSAIDETSRRAFSSTRTQ